MDQQLAYQGTSQNMSADLLLNGPLLTVMETDMGDENRGRGCRAVRLMSIGCSDAFSSSDEGQ